MKHALITGANGQDGVLLGRYLRSLGYAVTGIVRGLDRVLPEGVHRCLLPEAEGWKPQLSKLQLDEIYHLGGDSFAGAPQEGAVRLLESNVMLTARLLEAPSVPCPRSAFLWRAVRWLLGILRLPRRMRIHPGPRFPSMGPARPCCIPLRRNTVEQTSL